MICRWCGEFPEADAVLRERVFANGTHHREACCPACGLHVTFVPHDTPAMLHFGKYTGRTIAEVVAMDPDYGRWLLHKNLVKGRVRRALEAALGVSS